MNYKYADVDGLKVFYREAGDPKNPAMVLLHGFPSSSHMYRNLMAELADKFYLIAPDYPGFGNTDAPSPDKFSYTFDKLSEVVEKLLVSLGVKKFTMFIQDYGSPVGFRIAVRHPDWIEGIVSPERQRLRRRIYGRVGRAANRALEKSHSGDRSTAGGLLHS